MEARAQEQAALRSRVVELEPVHEITELAIPGPAGTLPARAYVPAGLAPLRTGPRLVPGWGMGARLAGGSRSRLPQARVRDALRGRRGRVPTGTGAPFSGRRGGLSRSNSLGRERVAAPRARPDPSGGRRRKRGRKSRRRRHTPRARPRRAVPSSSSSSSIRRPIVARTVTSSLRARTTRRSTGRRRTGAGLTTSGTLPETTREPRRSAPEAFVTYRRRS